MTIAMVTGRQIMRGIHSLGNGSAFDVHAAKCGLKVKGDSLGKPHVGFGENFPEKPAKMLDNHGAV